MQEKLPIYIIKKSKELKSSSECSGAYKSTGGCFTA